MSRTRAVDQKCSAIDGHRSAATASAYSVSIIDRTELPAVWRASFAAHAKDTRYYEIVEDTIRDGFDYRYLAIRDRSGRIRTVQPAFLIEQDVLQGVGDRWPLAARARRLFPDLLKVKTLMVGCTAGPGHLAAADGMPAALVADILSRTLVRVTVELGAQLVVLKEFPASERSTLDCFCRRGYARAPSMPMTALEIEGYAGFDDYTARGLRCHARKHLRKNLSATRDIQDIRMDVTNDPSPLVGEIYPLYLQVFERSKLHFEHLSPDYFRELGRRMPDKVRLFTWRRDGRLIAFGLCLGQDDALHLEYLGLDYAVALDLHLYYYSFRDIFDWAVRNGYKRLRSTALGYDPKLRLRYRLDPVDLYVRHTSPLPNIFLRTLLPWLVPARYDPTLRKFADYQDIW